MGFLTKILLGGATSPLAGDGYGISPSQLKSPRQSEPSPNGKSGGYFSPDRSTASSLRSTPVPSPRVSQQHPDGTEHNSASQPRHNRTWHRRSRSPSGGRTQENSVTKLVRLSTPIASVVIRPEDPRPSIESFRTASEISIGNEVADNVEVPEDAPEPTWESFEIPPELGEVEDDVPQEIKNIIQESTDEHTAMRASLLQSQVRIAQETMRNADASSEVNGDLVAESSAMASARSTPISDRSGSNLGEAADFKTSVESVGDDSDHLKLPLRVPSHRVIRASQDSSEARETRGPDLTEMERRFLESKVQIKKSRKLFKLLPSRKTQGAASPKNFRPEPIIVECTSCFDDLPNTEAVGLLCHHSYCMPCFAQLISTSIKHEISFPPKCCLTDIPKKTIRDNLPPLACAEFEEKSLEYAVPIGNRYYCVSSQCGRWIDTRYAARSNGAIECQHCAAKLCTVCRGPQHPANEDCPQDFGLDRTLEQAERAGWRRCYRCRTMVELNTGCRHITCKCSAEFCYTCGAVWQTCACTEGDQARRDHEIRARLAQYEADQRAEEEELRAAVVAVEAAERQIREEREAEEARVEEEARELERLETDRLQRIADYFEQLRSVLERVRLQQRSAIKKRHDAEWAEIDRMRQELDSPKEAVERDIYIKSEREKVIACTETSIKALQRQHASIMMETITRHRKVQDELFERTINNHDQDAEIIQADTLRSLMPSQDLERMRLQSKQASEIQNLKSLGEASLSAFDPAVITMEMRLERTEQIEERAKGLRNTIFADGKWLETVFGDRFAMLVEDERRLVQRGGEAPTTPILGTAVMPQSEVPIVQVQSQPQGVDPSVDADIWNPNPL